VARNGIENPKVRNRVSLAPNANLFFPGNWNGKCCNCPMHYLRIMNLVELDDIHDSGHDQMSVQAWTHGMHERGEPVGARQGNE
jgi:hypothetical protein